MITCLRTLCLLVWLGAGSFLCAQNDKVSIDFSADIKPILESNCLSCHNEENAEGGYRIDNRDDAMDYIEEGDAASSDFYLYLISDDEDEMMPPPDDGGPLDDSDIKLIKDWIDEGAQWPASVFLQEPANMDDQGDEPDAPLKSDAPGRVNGKPTVPYAIGLLHPATLHMPIGLLMAAGLFSLLSIRGNFVMSDCAYYCLWLGTLSSMVACLTGWWFTMDQYPNEVIMTDDLVAGLQNMDHKLFWHRTSAIIVTVLGLLLCLFAASARNRDPDEGVAWKFGAIILAMGIAYVGHEGGELSWKESHYDELWEVVDEYIPGVAGDEKPAADNVEAEPDGESANPEDVST